MSYIKERWGRSRQRRATRFQKRWGRSRERGKKRFVLITTMAMAITLLLLARVDSTTSLIAVGIPLALISAARTGPLQALMSEIVPGHMRGTLMGLRSAGMQIGISLFGVASGTLYYEAGFSAVLYLAAGAVVVSYFLIRLFLPGMK